jgi:hypothetical protein
MLMSTDDRRVDADTPIKLTSGISLRLDSGQQPIPGAISRESVMPLPHRLPRPKPLGQIPPRNSGAITVHDALDDLTMIPERPAPQAVRAGQHRLDPSPHPITEFSRTRHPFSLAPTPSTIGRHALGRFSLTLGQVAGRRLTYAVLTGKE